MDSFKYNIDTMICHLLVLLLLEPAGNYYYWNDIFITFYSTYYLNYAYAAILGMCNVKCQQGGNGSDV